MLDLTASLLHPFCTLEVEAGPVLSPATGRLGQRRIIPIIGGRVSGPGVNGRILPVALSAAPGGSPKEAFGVKSEHGRHEMKRLSNLVMGLAIAVALILAVSYIVETTDQQEIEGPDVSVPAS